MSRGAKTAALSQTVAMATALAAADVPLPLTGLYGVVACRSSFCRWRRDGLDVQWIDGLGLAVKPSVLRDFLTGRMAPVPETVVRRGRHAGAARQSGKRGPA